MSDVELDFDILDQDTEALFDAEKFEPAPAGTYKALFDWEPIKINGGPVAQFKFTIREVVDLADKTANPPEPGKLVQQAAFLTQKNRETGELERSKSGEGLVKEIANVLKPTYGGSTTRETLDNAKGGEVIITVRVKAKKDDPDVRFNVLKSITLE